MTRLTDEVMNGMAVFVPAQGLNDPEILTIQGDSLFKVFQQLPNYFEPFQRIVSNQKGKCDFTKTTTSYGNLQRVSSLSRKRWKEWCDQ